MNHLDIGSVAEVLLDYVEQDRTYQSDKITTVPSKSYTDPDLWAREMEVIFKRVPLMLALSCELPNPGTYKAMDAMGLPVLIVRDKTGDVRAFLNVCAHRGAPVADEGHGKCARFTCKYHSWTYGLDGKLLAVSDRQKFGEIDKATRGLRPLPCHEKAGMIFAVLTPEEEVDFDGFLAGMLDDYEALDFKNWSFLGARVIEGANWKIAFDGYLEGYHFSSLHPTTIHPRTPSNVTYYESFGAHLRIGFPQVSIRKLRDIPRDQWGAQENNGFDMVRILFPNVSAFLAPEIAQIAQLFPGPTPDKNRTVLLYARKTPPADAEDQANIEQMIAWLRDVTYKEDYLMGLEIQKGVESGAIDSVIFGKNERGNQFFHETVDWYLSGKQGPQPTV